MGWFTGLEDTRARVTNNSHRSAVWTAVVVSVMSAAGTIGVQRGCEAPPTPTPADPPPVVAPENPIEAALLMLHNMERSAKGRPSLQHDYRLSAAALKHAGWMADNRRMDHVGDGGSRFSDRIRREGYPARGGGENIAMGYNSVEDVVRGWMNSAGHKANILNEAWTDAGFGVAEDNRGRRYWCAVFGTKRSGALSNESVVVIFTVEPEGLAAVE